MNEKDFRFFSFDKPLSLVDGPEWSITYWKSIPESVGRTHRHAECNPHTHIHPGIEPVTHSHEHPEPSDSDPDGQRHTYGIKPHTHTNGVRHAHPHAYSDTYGVIDPLPEHTDIATF